jgi:hypothetical protein
MGVPRQLGRGQGRRGRHRLREAVVGPWTWSICQYGTHLLQKRNASVTAPRGMRIEYALIALLIAFATLQAYFAFGAKGI